MGGDGHKRRVKSGIKSGTKISQGVEVDHTGMVRVFYQNELKIAQMARNLNLVICPSLCTQFS